VHDNFIKLGGKQVPYDTILEVMRGKKDFKQNILKTFNINIGNNLLNNESK
jgi:hypothetical protein